MPSCSTVSLPVPDTQVEAADPELIKEVEEMLDSMVVSGDSQEVQQLPDTMGVSQDSQEVQQLSDTMGVSQDSQELQQLSNTMGVSQDSHARLMGLTISILFKD